MRADVKENINILGCYRVGRDVWTKSAFCVTMGDEKGNISHCTSGMGYQELTKKFSMSILTTDSFFIR
jgi:hypothetical protein